MSVEDELKFLNDRFPYLYMDRPVWALADERIAELVATGRVANRDMAVEAIDWAYEKLGRERDRR